MSMQKTTTHNIQVSVKVAYVESESSIEKSYHFFAYRIFITNKGSSVAQLMSRHWVITDGNGKVEEVRGPGVVGLQPKIYPDQTFEYESACPLHTSTGSMKGQYTMTSEDGDNFTVEIPEFYLIAPHSLH